VYDMGYFIIKPTIQVCAAFGYASGDASPTRDKELIGDSQVNSDYEGFIGIQESYSGTRVRSVFLLSGFGDIPRPLLFPSEAVSASFPISVTRFTNLVYAGMSGYYIPSLSACNWNYNVNMLGFWTDFSVPFLDRKTLQHGLNRCARNYLGTELNVFMEAQFTENIAVFAIGALFIPGSYFRDIKDRPLSKEQRKFLSNRSTIGSINARVPLLGADTAGFANIGLVFRF